MTINLAWPRDYFYGTKWYQQYGPITGIAVVVIAGLALYYGRQQHHGTVLASTAPTSRRRRGRLSSLHRGRRRHR